MESFSTAIVPQLPRLLSIARRLSPEPEDLVQETVARALRFRARFREGSDLRAWLTRILYNLCFGERRRSLRFQRARAAYAREPRPRPVEPSVAAELAEACPRLEGARVTMQLPPGLHSIDLTIVDAAGHLSTDTVVVRVR